MPKDRVIAVDDEQLALRRLEILLGRMEDVELVGTAASVASAMELIARLRPDVVLLDIAMPGQSGFDLIDMLDREAKPRIIFVTAFDQYAIEAFDKNAVGYVLKPVQPDKLRNALERARRDASFQAQAEQLRGVIAGLSAAPGDQYEQEVWAHRYSELVRVSVQDVRWAQAERDYVRLHTEQGSFLVRGTMDSLERRLNPREFARIHRSALVRVTNVVAIRRRSTGLLVAKLSSGEEVNIGRRFAKNFAAARATLSSAPLS